jgi:hypothetical protein
LIAEVNVLVARNKTKQESMHYAVSADFCLLFETKMDQFYRLSFLLTANDRMAEECLMRGLEDSAASNRVFREWADSWARRTIIHNAIQMVRPRPVSGIASSRTPDGVEGHVVIGPVEINAVVALPAFERFAFVMSVLERHSEQECVLLLGCTRNEMLAARIGALKQLGRSAQVRQESMRGPAERVPHGDSGSLFPLPATSQPTTTLFR